MHAETNGAILDLDNKQPRTIYIHFQVGSSKYWGNMKTSAFIFPHSSKPLIFLLIERMA